MEANEIMNNEEVMETVVEEAANAIEKAEAKTCKSLKTAVGIGAVILAGFVIYKYVAKPALSKLKEKHDYEAEKAAKRYDASPIVVDVDDEDRDDIPKGEIEE